MRVFDKNSPLRFRIGNLALSLTMFTALSAMFVAIWYEESHRLRENAPAWILCGGLVASLLIAWVLYQRLRHRSREVEGDRKQLEALESLNEITAVISSRLGDRKDLLDYLASSACRLLETDQACVLLFDADRRQFNVMANIGFPVTHVGQILPVEGSPMCEHALVTGQIIASEDLLNEKRPNNHTMTQQQGVRSMLFIPLYVQTNRVGLLLVGSTKQRKFTDHNLRLAQLLSTQVAVTITNSRLYEQMSESLRAQQRLQLQRERLTAITLAVYQASSLDESLKRLVELAPAALEMDLCIVSLISEDGTAMCAAAATAPFEGLIGKRFEIAGRNSEKVLKTRQMLVIDDGAENQSIHEELRRQVRVGSIVYIPLFESNDQPLGLLLLVRHTAGSFSDEQLRLAQVFASRASGAIESARLYQQTRRDAETKAMLLRELNHRVKNNLAGIVGLLSTRPEGLDFPPQAQQWLDRVIDRISIMGRAHELFVGGPQTMGLGELIDQLLPTLSIVKPAGVRVVKELDGVSVTLSTERAVALAMVLHELCCNAIAHGLGDRGTIVIRAHTHATGVVIEVVDDGIGLPRRVASSERAPVTVDLKLPPSRAASTSGTENKGWGLRLVEGLVSRELRGRFTMSNSPDLNGGTIARVEFPISSGHDGSRNP